MCVCVCVCGLVVCARACGHVGFWWLDSLMVQELSFDGVSSVSFLDCMCCSWISLVEIRIIS